MLCMLYHSIVVAVEPLHCLESHNVLLARMMASTNIYKRRKCGRDTMLRLALLGPRPYPNTSFIC